MKQPEKTPSFMEKIENKVDSFNYEIAQEPDGSRRGKKRNA